MWANGRVFGVEKQIGNFSSGKVEKVMFNEDHDSRTSDIVEDNRYDIEDLKCDPGTHARRCYLPLRKKWLNH